MSFSENLIGVLSINTSADHTSNQFKFIAADGTIAGVGDAMGVMQDALDGSVDGPKPMKVGYLGVSKLFVNGNSVNIAVGDFILSNASGIGVTKATILEADIVMGRALEASTADGDIISVLIQPPSTVL